MDKYSKRNRCNWNSIYQKLDIRFIAVILAALVICLSWQLFQIRSFRLPDQAIAPVVKRRSTSVPCDSTVSKSQRPDINVGINIVNPSRYYKHHEIFNEFPYVPYPMNSEYLTTFTGLKVPKYFDCMGATEGLNKFMDYYTCVADRWYECNYYHMAATSALEYYTPPLPIMDEEYTEHIAIYTAVKKSCVDNDKEWNIVEMGARWGTWGVRSLSAYKHICPHFHVVKMTAFYYEPVKEFCAGIHEIHKLNNFEKNYVLVCDIARSEHFLSVWNNSGSVINVLDMDIQGEEWKLVSATQHIIHEKVMKVIIGTHGPEIHENIRNLFINHPNNQWKLIHEYKCFACMYGGDYVHNHLRGIKNFTGAIKDGKYFDSEYGPMIPYDGELIFVNRKFYGN